MRPRPTALVARGRETAALDAFVDNIESGFAAVVLEGGPGIGKTTLWRYATARAAQRSVALVRCSPAAAEAHLPFAALADLLRPHVGELAPRLPSPQRRALEVALMLEEPGDEPAEAHAVAAGLLGCLRELARAGPVLVAVDDVQWLDVSSAAAIGFAARRIGDEPIGLLLGHRTQPPGPLPLALERSPLRHCVERLPVEPLDFGAIHTLVCMHAGAGTLSRPVIREIHDVSGGNPLFAIELAAAVRAAGGRLRPGRRLPVPGSLQGLVRDRVRRLPQSTRDALTAAAALADPLLETIARLEPSLDACDSLSAAVDDGLIALDGESIRFSHPLYAAAVYELADPAARRAVHRQLASAVTDVGEQAAHLALASDAPEAGVATTVALAAELAAARGAPEAAADLAEHARRLTPPRAVADRARVTLAASDYAFAAGDPAGARRLLAELAGSPDAELRAQALVRLCTLATFDGTVPEARDLAQRALAEPVGNLALDVAIHRRAALVSLLESALGEAEPLAERAAELAERLGDRRVLAAALASLAFIRLARGSSGVDAVLDRALALEQAAGSGLIDDSPSATAGLIAMIRGDLDAAREYFETELAEALTRGGDPLATGILFILGDCCVRGGRFEEGLALAERGLAAAEQSGQYSQRAVLLYVKALSAGHLGRADEARRAGAEGLEIAERGDYRWAIAQHLRALGLLDLSQGRAADAFGRLGRSIGLLREGGVRDLGIVPAHADAVEAAIGAGRLREAAVLERELAAAATAPWLRLDSLRARGLLDAANGDLDAAVETLNHAVSEGTELEHVDFALARTRLALGVTLRRSKRKRPARDEIEAARAMFERLGATLWAARAGEELTRIGGRTAARDDELTPSERRVAELVAAGRTNKEVAAELFVSVRAVEANLTKVYAKLGLRSRVELARELGDRTPE